MLTFEDVDNVIRKLKYENSQPIKKPDLVRMLYKELDSSWKQHRSDTFCWFLQHHLGLNVPLELIQAFEEHCC